MWSNLSLSLLRPKRHSSFSESICIPIYSIISFFRKHFLVSGEKKIVFHWMNIIKFLLFHSIRLIRYNIIYIEKYLDRSAVIRGNGKCLRQRISLEDKVLRPWRSGLSSMVNRTNNKIAKIITITILTQDLIITTLWLRCSKAGMLQVSKI